MRSSTLDSSVRCPDGPWLKTWLLTAVLVIALLVGWESTLRALGHRPTVVDDETLWAVQRDRVYGDCCEKVVVLLGDCRIQLGIVPQVLREEFPRYRTVQLAVQETSPVATLRDLAEDERFDGVVICGVNARILCKDMWDTQQSYVDYYHSQYNADKKLNRLISAAVQRTFAAAHPSLRLDDIVVHWAKHRAFPSPYYIETHADRSRLADYSNVDLPAHRAWAVGRAQWLCYDRVLPGALRWLLDLKELERDVQAIQTRGGRVIFVRLPTTGEHLRYDEWIFPRRRYWDAFAAQTSAECIHFADVPALARFDCPDTSHLDRSDAPHFTRELARVLDGRGLLASPQCAFAQRTGTDDRAKCPCRNRLRRLITFKPCACCQPQATDHLPIASR